MLLSSLNRGRLMKWPGLWAQAASIALAWSGPGGSAAQDTRQAVREAVVETAEFRPVTRYERLVEELSSRPLTEMEEFARIAVEQMLVEHEEALANLQDQRVSSVKAARKQVTWGRATERFLEQLDQVSSMMASGEVIIEVEGTPAGEVYVFVDDQPVVVSSLNLEEPQLLEERILDAFCVQFDCTGLEPVEPVRVQPAYQPGTRAGWSFGDGMASTFRTRDGLSFMFLDLRNRARKQQMSVQVAEELRLIAGLLGKASANGYAIEWSSLRLEQGPGGRQPARVVFNARGTFVRAKVPALTAAPDFLEIGRAWIRATAAGEPYEQSFPRADLFLQDGY